MFKKMNHVIVANKVDIKDDKKLAHLKDNFDKVHAISLIEGKGLEKLKDNIVSLERLS